MRTICVPIIQKASKSYRISFFEKVQKFPVRGRFKQLNAFRHLDVVKTTC